MSTHIDALVKMINQIADNAPKKDDPEATAKAVASHVEKFWAKSMKAEIKDYLNAKGEGLNEISTKAIRHL